MTRSNPNDAGDEDSLAVLDEAAPSLETAGIGLIDGTAQVSVAIPTGGGDDEFIDDAVISGEVADPVDDETAVTAELVWDGAFPEIAASASVSDAAVEAEDVDAVTAADDAITVDETVADAEAAAERAIAEAGTTGPARARTTATAEDRAHTTDRSTAQEKEERMSGSEQSGALTPTRRGAARPQTEVTLTSKRLDDQRGQASRESADLLTTDRLIDPQHMSKPEPEGAWSHFLYTISGHRINIGDGKRAKVRKQLTARIAAPLAGGARFVPVLSRKGGVGKTTVTTLLGMALADAREDRVIAIDANPDRGTLAERIVRGHNRSVRDLVRQHEEIRGYHDVSAIVARDRTRLDVLASDADPRVSEAFSDEDYRNVASVAAHYYSLVLTDTGTGIVHSVMGATLDLADQLVIVSGLSVDEARLASETLTWLETNGCAELAHDAVVVLNQSTPGTPLVRLNELESHFGTRVRRVVRIPYDPHIAAGGVIEYTNLQQATRQAARELSAVLVEGLRAGAA